MAARQLVVQPHIPRSVYVVRDARSTELVENFRDMTKWIRVRRSGASDFAPEKKLAALAIIADRDAAGPLSLRSHRLRRTRRID